MAIEGVVRNLGLIAPVVRGYWYVGTVAGMIERAQVTGSYAQGVEVTGWWRVGGLIGITWGGRVLESYATGKLGSGVSGREAGGLIGLANAHPCGSNNQVCSRSDIQVKYAFASVDVTSNGYSGSGGLVGTFPPYSSRIQHTYATGTVTAVGAPNGFSYWGSLVGILHGGTVPVSQSYATGPISGNPVPRTDGLIGEPRTGGLIGGCVNLPTGWSWFAYWDTETTGQTHSACNRVPGDPSATTIRERHRHSLGRTTVGGKTTSELQTPTSASGIYSTWGPITVDGVGIPVWDFGTSSEYPILVYCSAKPGIDLREGKTEYCPLREATQHGRTYSPSP